MSLSAIPRELRTRIFDRDGGYCRYCGQAQLGQAAVFHINHVVPWSQGGAEEPNLVLQCPCCSLHKSNKTHGTDPQTGASVRLFHPLDENWHAHFALNQSGECIGRTPTGRASIAALSMNDLLPRVARRMQIQAGILFASES